MENIFLDLNMLQEHNDEYSILLFSNESLIFYIIAEDNAASSLILYETNLNKNVTSEIGRIENFYLTTNSAVIIDGELLFTVCTLNNDSLSNQMYSYKNGDLSILYSWESDIPMSYVMKGNMGEVILFYPRLIDKSNEEYYEYNIEKIIIKDGSSSEIMHFEFNNTRQEGDIIPTCSYSSDVLYIYKKTVNGEESSYTICEYNLKGELQEEYYINIEDFLYIELTGAYDSVYKLYSYGDKYVLQTLNNRIIIFEQKDSQLVRVTAPGCLTVFPEGYRIMEYSENNSSVIYFVNVFQTNIMKYDMRKNEFFELNSTENSGEFIVNYLGINSNEEILIKEEGKLNYRKENNFSIITEY